MKIFGIQSFLLKKVSAAALVLFLCGSCAMKLTTQPNRVCFKESCFYVEVVQKPQELMRGLQFRGSLAQNAGMLFVFPNQDFHDFWMKDTLIALDMIWLDDQKEIVFIALDAKPCIEEPCTVYGPKKRSRYVLEINASKAQALKLKIGDRAEFYLDEKAKE